MSLKGKIKNSPSVRVFVSQRLLVELWDSPSWKQTSFFHSRCLDRKTKDAVAEQQARLSVVTCVVRLCPLAWTVLMCVCVSND